jgi:hypothetical protein
VRESYREGPAQLHTPFVADQLQAQPVPTGAAVAPLTVKTMPDLELTNTPLLPEGLSDGEGDEALSAPARIPLRGTVRRFNLVGQHGAHELWLLNVIVSIAHALLSVKWVCISHVHI